MNDSIRRAAAILLGMLGGAALGGVGNGAPAPASADDAMVAAIGAAAGEAGRGRTGGVKWCRGAARLVRGMAEQAAKGGECAEPEEPGKLQRFCSHGKLDKRRADRDGAQ